MRRAYVLALLAGVAIASAGAIATEPADGLPNPFYAMDTCTKDLSLKSDIPPSAQFDLLKETGYSGTAWTEEAPEAVTAALAALKSRGLTMYAIYCGATDPGPFAAGDSSSRRPEGATDVDLAAHRRQGTGHLVAVRLRTDHRRASPAGR
jgi:hypothetical protein